MKCISVLCVLSALIAVILAAPTTLDESAIVPFHNQVKRQTSDDQQAAIDRIVMYSNEKLAQLRKFCPQIFQIIDAVVQNVTSQVFRVVGSTLLRSGGLGGGGASAGGGSGGGRVSVVLPTFPPDEDEDEDDEEEANSDISIRTADASVAIGLSATTTDSNEISNNEVSDLLDRISSNTNSPSSNTSSESSSIATVEISSTSTSSPSSTSTTVANSPEPFTSPSVVSKRHVRITRAADPAPADGQDQESAASGDSNNGPDPAADISNVEADDADRNKRFLPFGGEGGGSAGGSGNFLFDLIRNTADRAARTVGTVYRMVAGTESLGLGISASATSSKTLAPASQLVAGSGGTEDTDEKEAGIGGAVEVDVKASEGVPGPITRLLVVANRGIANLIQDLILRLAQTSEKIVNFKARLVTSLI